MPLRTGEDGVEEAGEEEFDCGRGRGTEEGIGLAVDSACEGGEGSGRGTVGELD